MPYGTVVAGIPKSRLKDPTAESSVFIEVRCASAARGVDPSVAAALTGALANSAQFGGYGEGSGYELYAFVVAAGEPAKMFDFANIF